jgi:hypothetical protein
MVQTACEKSGLRSGLHGRETLALRVDKKLLGTSWRPVEKFISRWMRRLRTSKTRGFFEVRFRGKRPWRAFPTASE